MSQQASAQARLTLCDAFERFAATVTPDDKREFEDTKLKDVRDEAIKIERQLRARRTQRNMARLQPFLLGMEHYSKVVEVLCNGTPYLSWIWAPVKLMLMITVDTLSAFEKLIDAYGKIADMLPRFDRLASALNHDHNVQVLLALVYADVLEFHRRAYKFVRRKSWAIFFGSMWAGFESRFGSILESLAYHSELLDKEAVAVNISDAIARSTKDIDRWKQQEREWQAHKVRTVLSWLATDESPPEDTLDRHTRGCLPDSCEWFIQHHQIQLWLKDGKDNALLWLYGKPGAGKSVLCSQLVQHAETKGINTFFFFCSYLGSSIESSCRLLRSLTAQIIQKHRDLAIHVHEKYAQSYPVPSRRALLAILPELLQGLGSVRFVIDGIDEWDERAQKEVLQDVMQMLSTDPSCICKIMIASRDTLEISRSIRKKKNKAAVSISLSGNGECTAIDRSIEHFIDSKLLDLPDHFLDLDPDASETARIKRVLREKSNGMFLWVRLDLDTLDIVYNAETLRSLVEGLPSDLESLYERIFHRLCDSRGPKPYGGVPRILSWICFSQRPLHKYELLHALAVHPTNANSDTQSVPLEQILDHCKPLIEEQPDSTVVLVHFSVKEFFVRSNAAYVVLPTQAQLDISLVCATTLFNSLDLLRPNASLSENRVRIATGTYRLLPYALEYWIEHCLLYAAKESIVSLNQQYSHQLTRLHEKHNQLVQELDTAGVIDRNASGDFGSHLDDRLKHIFHLSIRCLVEEVLHIRWLTGQHPCESGENAEAFAIQNDQTLFSKLAAQFETTVAYLLSHEEIMGISKSALQTFQKSYASTAFRCRFPNCLKSFPGTASPDLRRQHEAGHFHRLYCGVEGCQWSRIGFSNKRGLDAHMRKHHREDHMALIPQKVRRTAEAPQPPAAPQQLQQQQSQGQSSQPDPQATKPANDQQQQQRVFESEILRHVQAFPFSLPLDGPQAGTPAGKAKLKKDRFSYTIALRRLYRSNQRVKIVNYKIREKEQASQEIPAELLNQKQLAEKDFNTTKDFFDSFRRKQAENKVAQDRRRAQAQQQPIDNNANLGPSGTGTSHNTEFEGLDMGFDDGDFESFLHVGDDASALETFNFDTFLHVDDDASTAPQPLAAPQQQQQPIDNNPEFKGFDLDFNDREYEDFDFHSFLPDTSFFYNQESLDLESFLRVDDDASTAPQPPAAAQQQQQQPIDNSADLDPSGTGTSPDTGSAGPFFVKDIEYHSGSALRGGEAPETSDFEAIVKADGNLY